MNTSELCIWLRQNSAGIYRPAADAANEIEHLRAENVRLSLELAAAREALNWIANIETGGPVYQYRRVLVDKAREALSPYSAVSAIEAVLKTAEEWSAGWYNPNGLSVSNVSRMINNALFEAVRSLRGEK
jgi:hypothetical protein